MCCIDKLIDQFIINGILNFPSPSAFFFFLLLHFTLVLCVYTYTIKKKRLNLWFERYCDNKNMHVRNVVILLEIDIVFFRHSFLLDFLLWIYIQKKIYRIIQSFLPKLINKTSILNYYYFFSNQSSLYMFS